MGNMSISKVFGANFSKSGLAAAALIASLAAAPLAIADDDQAENAKEAAAVAGAKLTLSQAIEAAKKEVPDAKVVKAEVDTSALSKRLLPSRLGRRPFMDRGSACLTQS
jgi:hypothetical protein